MTCRGGTHDLTSGAGVHVEQRLLIDSSAILPIYGMLHDTQAKCTPNLMADGFTSLISLPIMHYI